MTISNEECFKAIAGTQIRAALMTISNKHVWSRRYPIGGKIPRHDLRLNPSGSPGPHITWYKLGSTTLHLDNLKSIPICLFGKDDTRSWPPSFAKKSTYRWRRYESLVVRSYSIGYQWPLQLSSLGSSPLINWFLAFTNGLHSVPPLIQLYLVINRSLVLEGQVIWFNLGLTETLIV